MKAIKFVKRDRRTAGRATGGIIVTISIPFLEEKYVLNIRSERKQKTIETTKKNIKKHLEKADELLVGASFVIDAEIRASSGALRRKRLAKWTYGESISTIFETVNNVWETMDFEDDDYEPFEVEI